MFKKVFLIFAGLTTISASQIARAGGDVSGGGNAMVCFDDPSIVTSIGGKPAKAVAVPDSALKHITVIETLDLLEAEQTYPGRIITAKTMFPPNALNPNGFEDSNGIWYYDDIVNRMFSYIPSIPNLFWGAHEAFIFNEKYQDGSVDQIDDFGPVLPTIDFTRCVLSTVANQFEQDGKYHVTYDRRLVMHEKNSILSRSVLTLHENFYYWARKIGEKNTLTTRAFIRELISDHGILFSEFREKAVKLGFLSIDQFHDKTPAFRTPDWRLRPQLEEDARYILYMGSTEGTENCVIKRLCPSWPKRDPNPLATADTLAHEGNDLLKQSGQSECSRFMDCYSKISAIAGSSQSARDLFERMKTFRANEGSLNPLEEYYHLSRETDFLARMAEPHPMVVDVNKKIHTLTARYADYLDDFLFTDGIDHSLPFKQWMHPVLGKWDPEAFMLPLMEKSLAGLDYPVLANPWGPAMLKDLGIIPPSP